MQNSVAPVAAVSRAASTERRDVEPHRAHRRLEAPGLAAEVAVLGAAAGLDRDDPLDLHLRPAPAHPDLVGELERVVDALVRELEDLERLRLVEADAPLEDLLTGDVEDHAGISMVVSSALAEACRGRARSARGRPGCTARRGRGRAARSRSRCRGSVRPRRLIASTVSAVWLSVPRPARATTISGASSSSRDVGDRAALVVEAHEQPAGALDDHEVVLSVSHERRRPRCGVTRRQAGARARPSRARAARGSARACAPRRRTARARSPRRRRRPSARA